MVYDYKAGSDKIIPEIEANMENFIDLIAKAISRLTNNKSYYYKIVNYDTQNNFVDYYHEKNRIFYHDYLEKKFGEGIITYEIESTIEFYCAGATNLVIKWIQGGKKEDPKELASIIFRCMPNQLKELI